MDFKFILDAIQVVVGAIVMFLAIMLWSRTREPAWMVLVLAAVLLYVSITIGVLERLGLISLNFEIVWLGLVVQILLANLHLLLLAISLFLAIRLHR